MIHLKIKHATEGSFLRLERKLSILTKYTNASHHIQSSSVLSFNENLVISWSSVSVIVYVFKKDPGRINRIRRAKPLLRTSTSHFSNSQCDWCWRDACYAHNIRPVKCSSSLGLCSSKCCSALCDKTCSPPSHGTSALHSRRRSAAVCQRHSWSSRSQRCTCWSWCCGLGWSESLEHGWGRSMLARLRLLQSQRWCRATSSTVGEDRNIRTSDFSILSYTQGQEGNVIEFVLPI